MKYIRYLLLIEIMSLCISLKSQNYQILIDSTDLKKRTDIVKEYICSVDSLRERVNDFCVFFVFNNSLKDKDIDESSISEEYYLSGDFIRDMIDLKINKKSNGIFLVNDVIVCDTVCDNVYEYRPYNGLIGFFDKQYYSFIARLFVNKQIDCVFYYPTYVNEQLDIFLHYEPLMHLMLAIKNDEYYVIKGCVSKDEDNKTVIIPIMISLEDYIDCCWEEMTNLPRR